MTMLRTRWWHAWHRRERRLCGFCGGPVEDLGRKKRTRYWGCPACGYAMPVDVTVRASQVDAVTEAWPRTAHR
jgi:tRNA(Ile2) C34 agmatinyltransferase TiaS